MFNVTGSVMIKVKVTPGPWYLGSGLESSLVLVHRTWGQSVGRVRSHTTFRGESCYKVEGDSVATFGKNLVWICALGLGNVGRTEVWGSV